MTLFDHLVDEALMKRPELSTLRMVVEKELLHHDILRVLHDANILSKLTFIGGTCLRACYGSPRLSEDLDFTGGINFHRDQLPKIGHILVSDLKKKYGLNTEISEPTREIGNTDTWRLKLQTRPGRRDLPNQRINIDICAIPSYQIKPSTLLNPYQVEMGTSGLILQTESREEIFADKLIAFALRPNKLKYRDLWDLVWLFQQGLKPAFEIIPKKIQDHHTDISSFFSSFTNRCELLQNDPKLAIEFAKEMQRFLPRNLQEQVQQSFYWETLIRLMNDLKRDLRVF